MRQERQREVDRKRHAALARKAAKLTEMGLENNVEEEHLGSDGEWKPAAQCAVQMLCRCGKAFAPPAPAAAVASNEPMDIACAGAGAGAGTGAGADADAGAGAAAEAGAEAGAEVGTGAGKVAGLPRREASAAPAAARHEPRRASLPRPGLFARRGRGRQRAADQGRRPRDRAGRRARGCRHDHLRAPLAREGGPRGRAV